jgi:hypothetical protein
VSRPAIGFDRRIDLDWLDAAATAALSGDVEEVRERLHAYLATVIAGDGPRSARAKTVTVLCRTWSAVHPDAVWIRDRALALLGAATADERLALHWAMLSVNYPFFADVAGCIGRLLALQGRVSLLQVTQRLVSRSGDRSTLRRAVQRVTRSMVEWGVITDTDVRGTYGSSGALRQLRKPVAEILVESVLYREERWSLPVPILVGHPTLFPFRVDLTAHDLRSADGLQVHRQGLDEDIVERDVRRPSAGWSSTSPTPMQVRER